MRGSSCLVLFQEFFNDLSDFVEIGVDVIVAFYRVEFVVWRAGFLEGFFQVFGFVEGVVFLLDEEDGGLKRGEKVLIFGGGKVGGGADKDEVLGAKKILLDALESDGDTGGFGKD